MHRWGGYCTCPNGQKYGVGADSYTDKGGSLACEGGTMSKLFKRFDTKWGIRKVNCDQSCVSGGTDSHCISLV